MSFENLEEVSQKSLGNDYINDNYFNWVSLKVKVFFWYHVTLVLLLFLAPGVIKYWKQRYFVLTSDGYLNIYDQPRGSLLKKVNVSQQTTLLQVGF